jgi:ADP-ribosyl-[dinitrogen reductase] hydrolase
MQSKEVVDRAQGCLMGQLAGDALGSLVEFQSPEAILRAYPQGVRKMAQGGTWDTLAGQPTDDSELALLLARMLVKQGAFAPEHARDAYLFWLHSNPFDCGATTSAGLKGYPNALSQANGALMRISPLGIFGTNYTLQQVAEWARQDAAITHPNPVCQQANALFAMALSHAIKTHAAPHDLYQMIVTWSEEQAVDTTLRNVIQQAAEAPPADYVYHQGWVLIAFHNTLWQLLHAPNLEEGVVDTIMHGGDTDTNAAICGALLGAVYGLDAVPLQWVTSVLGCRPKIGTPGVYRPRPECFWPVDALDLAARLVSQSDPR